MCFKAQKIRSLQQPKLQRGSGLRGSTPISDFKIYTMLA